jgi:nicotinamidase-related amidase
VPDPTFDPPRIALLVLDYQPVVLDPLPDASDLLKHTRQAIDTVRQAGGHVGYVRVGFEEADYPGVPATNALFRGVAAARALPAAAPQTAIHPDVAPEPSDFVVRKTRIGPFTGTALDQQLRGRGVDTVVIAGLHTSGAVLSTVRHAFDLDYRIVLLTDCVADPDPEVHRVLVEKVLARQAVLATSESLAGLLGAE